MPLTRILLMMIAAAAPALCAETVLELEPQSTAIDWTLKAALHTVHGTFRLTKGMVSFDPATGKASGELLVAAASGESGNKSRDARMHKSILESAAFPEIVFRPDRVEDPLPARGSATIRVHGFLRLHGGDHEMTLPIAVNVEPCRITAATKFSIPYVQWGLKNPSTFLLRVGDKVDVEIRTAGPTCAGPREK